MTTDLQITVFGRFRIAYRGYSTLITDRAGMMTEGLHGLYYYDMRLLSRYCFFVNGQIPWLVSLTNVEANSTHAYFVTSADKDIPSLDRRFSPQGSLDDRQVILRVARFVGQGMYEDVELTNYGTGQAQLALAWELDADFADQTILWSGKQEKHDFRVSSEWQAGVEQSELAFTLEHSHLHRGVRIQLNSSGTRIERHRQRLTTNLAIAPHESRRICVGMAPIMDGERKEPWYGCNGLPAGVNDLDRVRLAWTTAATQLETSHPAVQLAWDRAIGDLGALGLGEGETDAEKAVPAAGVPLFANLYGRDALTVAGQALLFTPVLAEGALRLLGRNLGTKIDDFYDEQPGRVPFQVNYSPNALLGRTPMRHYYGDYAAPLAYLILFGAYHVVVGDTRRIREFLPSARRVLDWVRNYADLDGDGFLEYQTRSPQGMKHQGWKDSPHAVLYEDGRDVEAPIATCEIQGYWYLAQLLLAEVLFALGERDEAKEFYRAASEFKKRFNERFWMPQEKFIAFALDPAKRQVKTIASNAGHCLATGIIDKELVPDVARRLMAPDMFSGWGVRTLSSTHPKYNPFSYHLGAIWPVENATIAMGLRRYGFDEESNQIVKGIFDAASLFPLCRLPEAIGGHPRDDQHPHPGIFPEAEAPQAWSASAIAWLVQAMLGLWTYAPLHVLILDPNLPEWLPELTLRGLQVKDSHVSVRFKRKENQTRFEVLEKEGTAHVLRQPFPNDLDASVWERLRDLVGSLPNL